VTLSTAIASYFVLWWITLFAILPWGVRSQRDSGEVVPGSEPGAPVLPRLALRLLWTTIVATAIFAAFAFLFARRILTLDFLESLFKFPH
jgi:predicted secreted protein